MNSVLFYEQLTYWLFAGGLALICVLTLALIVLKVYPYIVLHNNFNKKMKEVKDMKEKGEHHEWIEINLNGEIVHACKKTGYVPKHDGFVNTDKLKAYLADKEERERELQIAKEYMLGVAEEIANRNNITADQVAEITKEYTEKQSHYFSQKIKDRMEQILNKKH